MIDSKSAVPIFWSTRYNTHFPNSFLSLKVITFHIDFDYRDDMTYMFDKCPTNMEMSLHFTISCYVFLVLTIFKLKYMYILSYVCY